MSYVIGFVLGLIGMLVYLVVSRIGEAKVVIADDYVAPKSN